MLTDKEVFNWLLSELPDSVDKESALQTSEDAGWERAVFELADEAFGLGMLKISTARTLCNEYPDGWLNVVYSGYLAKLLGKK